MEYLFLRQVLYGYLKDSLAEQSSQCATNQSKPALPDDRHVQIRHHPSWLAQPIVLKSNSLSGAPIHRDAPQRMGLMGRCAHDC